MAGFLAHASSRPVSPSQGSFSSVAYGCRSLGIHSCGDSHSLSFSALLCSLLTLGEEGTIARHDNGRVRKLQRGYPKAASHTRSYEGGLPGPFLPIQCKSGQLVPGTRAGT